MGCGAPWERRLPEKSAKYPSKLIPAATWVSSLPNRTGVQLRLMLVLFFARVCASVNAVFLGLKSN